MSISLWATPARWLAAGMMDVTVLAPASRRASMPAIPSTSSVAGMNASCLRSLMAAMHRSSLTVSTVPDPSIGVPAWGTNVIARIWSHPMDAIRRMVSTLSWTVSPMPTIMPSSASMPQRMGQIFWFMR